MRGRSRSVAKSLLPEDGKDTEDAVEKLAQRKRQNQILIIYIFICCIVVLAWCLGTWQQSFFWVFCLVVVIFFVWKGKVLSLTEQYIKEKTLLMHRKRALRNNETTEWLNFIINRWWVFCASTISDIVKKKIDPLLMDVKPSYLESLELESVSFGDKTPFIKYIQVYECADGVGGGKRPLSLSVAMQPPPGLQQAHQFQLVLEVDLGVQCDEFLMILRARLSTRLGALDIAVEKLNLSGLMQVIVRLDMDAPFPHIASASVSFLEKPEVSFSVRTLRVIPVSEIPFLKTWIYHLVMNGLSEALVDPGKLDFTTTSTGPTKVLSKSQPKILAIGVLTFTIHGEYLKSQDKGKKDKVNSNLMDDSRFCVVNLGSHESHMPMAPTAEPWIHKDSFLIYNMKTDKLVIDVKSQVLLTTQSLAKFEIGLASLVFENQRCTLPLTKQIDDAEVIKLTMSLQRTDLPNIEKSIEEGSVEMTANDSVGGVVYICLHNGINLLGLDANGFSDPYCVIYIGGKKLKCTHYVPRTRNPKWEVSSEVIVKDISKAVLSFVVYDWDGRSISEDDFLGSAHVLLSQEKPFLIRKNLNLGYNLMAQDSAEDANLGTICVTAIFTPIPCIGRPQSSVSSNLSTQLSSKPQLPSDKKPKSRKSSTMPADTGGVVEIKIIRAKNLVAMDRNGLSDPFCEVKVGGRKRYVTSIKKKTLSPVWDELVTTEMPKQNETLEILVWDHDVLFQKDFLGSLSFTLQQLMQYTSDSQKDEWFSLQRIASGSIQLSLKVNSAYNHQLPQVDNGTLATQQRQEESSLASDLDTSVSIRTETDLNQSQKSDIVSPTETLKVDGKSTLTTSSSSHKLNRKFSDTFPVIRKTASDAAINGDLADKKRDLSETRSSDQRSKSASLKNDTDSVSSSATEEPVDILSSTDVYYGVRGHIIGLTGLQETVSHAYIKVKLFSRLEENPRKPSAGHILTKSSSFHVSPDIKMDVGFEVDRGHGVHKKSQLVFDVKSGRYSHIAIRGFSLAELFVGDQKESTVMLDLESGVKVKVKMNYDGLVAPPGLSSNAHRSHSFLGGFRSNTLRSNTLKKIKEH